MKKTNRIIAVFIIMLIVLASGAMTAFASEGAADESGGIDITTATPEEIEGIGMAAMLEAGLAQEGDVEIIDVTPQKEVQEADGKSESSAVSAIDIVILVLLIVAILAIALLYFFCWKAGIVDIDVFRIKG